MSSRKATHIFMFYISLNDKNLNSVIVRLNYGSQISHHLAEPERRGSINLN